MPYARERPSPPHHTPGLIERGPRGAWARGSTRGGRKGWLSGSLGRAGRGSPHNSKEDISFGCCMAASGTSSGHIEPEPEPEHERQHITLGAMVRARSGSMFARDRVAHETMRG